MDDKFERMKLIDKLIDMADKHNIEYSVPSGGSTKNSGFADFIFKMEEDLMLGVQLAPVGSVKPLSTFPDGQPMTFEDMDNMLKHTAYE
ncbi:hypothetical protein [Aquibacillus albus]|uniref:Uncharacterized protein n=1 Tax=Aquibacillus albus TaxID=1168171 RepID=A0ABS2N2Q9_9BACI|nr:hypothetical protein [Aquibacillus albus]MBM7572348.1 hypothetical protein [Aquibacillus albus]